LVVCSAVFLNVTPMVSLLSSQVSTSAEKIHVVVGEGVASKVTKRVDEARRLAVHRALRDGVLQSLAVLITPEQAAKLADEIQKHILPGAHKYVREFSIIRENEKPEIYSVRLQATIDQAKLQADLSKLIMRGGAGLGPLTLLMLVERDDALDAAHYWWDISRPVEAALTSTYRRLAEGLETRGFRMIARDEALQEIKLRGLALPPDVSDEDAAELGKVFGANVVILVQAEVSRRDGKSSRIMMWSRGIEVDSVRLLARAESEQTVESDNPDWAYEEAVQRCSSEILDSLQDIVNTWRAASSDAITVELTVTGVRNYRYFLQIQRILTERIPELQFLTSFSIESGVYHTQVRFQGPITYLAHSLESVAYGEFELEVERQGDRSLLLHVRFPEAAVNS